MQPFEFRAATAQDLRRVVAMKLAMFEESGHANAFAANASEVIFGDYQRLYVTSEAQHFVAETEGAVVACAGAFLKSDLPFRYFQVPVYGFIGDVFTEPAFRARGIAKALNEKALAWLRLKGVSMVRLLASEAGRPLYAKLGFVASDEMVLTGET